MYQDPVGRASFCQICSGGLDEPYSAKPALPSSDTGPPARLHRMDTVPAYVDWRACTATPLSVVT